MDEFKLTITYHDESEGRLPFVCIYTEDEFNEANANDGVIYQVIIRMKKDKSIRDMSWNTQSQKYTINRITK